MRTPPTMCGTPGTVRDARARTWVILLAGGEGTRLRGAWVGGELIDRPKQFCRFGRNTSLLASTIDRAGAIARRETIVPTVLAAHASWWRPDLYRLPHGNVVVQPRQRGTGVAILHALIHVLRCDDQPIVVVLPTDHGVDDEAPLLAALHRAIEQAAGTNRDLVLIGVTPEHAEAQYGWILPGGPAGRSVRRVRSFVEKPSRTVAAALMEQGGLWNSLIFAASGRRLLELFWRSVPRLVLAYLEAMPLEGWTEDALAAFYATAPACDFSRDVLERCHDDLDVVSMEPCGWTDLGTPGRVAAWMMRSPNGRAARWHEEVPV